MRIILLLVSLLVFVYCLICIPPVSSAETNSTSSTSYEIDLGNGEGSVLIFGNNNTVYLPPDSQDKEDQIQPNEVTFNESRKSYMLVCTETDIIIDSTVTRFSKVVFELHGDGTWELVWFEQKDE